MFIVLAGLLSTGQRSKCDAKRVENNLLDTKARVKKGPVIAKMSDMVDRQLIPPAQVDARNLSVASRQSSPVVATNRILGVVNNQFEKMNKYFKGYLDWIKKGMQGKIQKSMVDRKLIPPAQVDARSLSVAINRILVVVNNHFEAMKEYFNGYLDWFKKRMQGKIQKSMPGERSTEGAPEETEEGGVEEGSVRLKGPQNVNGIGLVQVFYNNTWGYVDYERWSEWQRFMVDDIICMSVGDFFNVNYYYIEKIDVNISVDAINCSEENRVHGRRLRECEITWNDHDTPCPRCRVLGVCCSPNGQGVEFGTKCTELPHFKEESAREKPPLTVTELLKIFYENQGKYQ